MNSLGSKTQEKQLSVQYKENRFMRFINMMCTWVLKTVVWQHPTKALSLKQAGVHNTNGLLEQALIWLYDLYINMLRVLIFYILMYINQ